MISLSHAFDSLNLMRKGRRWERERTVIGVGNTSVNKNNHETVFCHLKDDEQIEDIHHGIHLCGLIYIFKWLVFSFFRLFSSIVKRRIASFWWFPLSRQRYLSLPSNTSPLCLARKTTTRETKKNVSYPMVPLINPQFQHCQPVYTRSKSLFLLFLSSSLYVPYRSLTCHNYEREEMKKLIRWRTPSKKRRDLSVVVFFFSSLSTSFHRSRPMADFLRLFFPLSFSLSNHSKLSWSMMMVGSALSFDLDASRLIYTSNTWHFFSFVSAEDSSSHSPPSLFNHGHQWKYSSENLVNKEW